MNYITSGGKNYPVEIIYSPRRKKTVSYSVKTDKNSVYILVRAPEGVKKEQIFEILKNNKRFLEKIKTASQKTYNTNSLICFKGKKYPLIIDIYILHDKRKKSYADLEFKEKYFNASVFISEKLFSEKTFTKNSMRKSGQNFPLKNITQNTFLKLEEIEDVEFLIKIAYSNFLKREAEIYSIREIEKFCSKNNYPKPESIQVGYFKSKWGSCCPENNIKINYSLLAGPEKYFKYIIIHEMCHMKIKNHSYKFWDLVKSYCPDYKKIRQELKENGHKLNL